jgi:UDP-GlcNAc:undecaprenyl-phosphate/decaprenyl-phosphate GlcNAc-1-phosphate transferase
MKNSAPLLTFLLVVILVPLLKRLAPSLGLLDLPTQRKRHVGAIPLVGGLAMFSAFVLASLALGLFSALPQGFLAGAAAFVLLGAFDDRHPLSSSKRLVAQACVLVLVTMVSANVLSDLGHLLGPWPIVLGGLGIPFTVFGFLGVLNAMNFADGADGLAGGIALTALVSFLAVFQLIHIDGAWPAAVTDARTIVMLLGGATAGFLVFNLRTPWRAKASIFMGDAGSLFLGFALGWIAIFACSQLGQHSLSPVAALWILIVPLFDTVSCMVRRKLDGRSPLKPDRYHVHHLLQSTGLSAGKAVAILIAVNAIGGFIGVTAWRMQVPDYFMFAVIVLCFCGYMVASRLRWRWVGSRDKRPVAVSRVYRRAPTTMHPGRGWQPETDVGP